MSKRGETYIRDEEDIIVAIKLSGGKLAMASRLLGYATSSGLYARVQNCPSLRQIVLDAREDTIDFAEDALQAAIKKGELRAITYFLDSQAKDRGYGVDKALINVNVTQNNLTLDMSALSDAEVKQLEELIIKASTPKLLEAGASDD